MILLFSGVVQLGQETEDYYQLHTFVKSVDSTTTTKLGQANGSTDASLMPPPAMAMPLKATTTSRQSPMMMMNNMVSLEDQGPKAMPPRSLPFGFQSDVESLARAKEINDNAMLEARKLALQQCLSDINK